MPVQPGGTTPAPEPRGGTTPSRGGTTGARPSPRGAQPGIRRGATARGRGKTNAFPWLAHVTLAWRAGFLPRSGEQGYDTVAQSVRHALTLAPDQGGWARGDLPTLVLTWDPSRPAHRKAVKALEADKRFVCSASLFNCVRVDARSLGKKARGGLSLSAWTRDARRIDEVSGSDRLRGAWHLLREAVKEDRRQELRKLLPDLQEALSALAHTEAHLLYLQQRLIDGKSGHVDRQVLERIQKVRKTWLGWTRKLATLRTSRG